MLQNKEKNNNKILSINEYQTTFGLCNFRAFIFNSKLSAICQLEKNIFYGKISRDEKEKIQKNIEKVFRISILPHIQNESFIVDFCLFGEKIFIFKIYSWEENVEAKKLFFDWQNERNILNQISVTFRLRDIPLFDALQGSFYSYYYYCYYYYYYYYK